MASAIELCEGLRLVSGQAAAQVLDVLVDAEDLLDHDDSAAPGHRGVGAPCSNRSRSFWLQFNSGHIDLLGFQQRLTLSAG